MLKVERDKEFKRKMEEYKKQKEDSQEKFEKLVKDQAKKQTEAIKATQASSLRDQIIMGTVIALWIGLVIYANYLEVFSAKQKLDNKI